MARSTKLFGILGGTMALALVGCERAPAAPPPALTEGHASCGEALFADLCRTDDGDAYPGIPPHHEIPCGTNPAERASPESAPALFEPLSAPLPTDFLKVQAICAQMDPAPHTRDTDRPEVLAAVRALFGELAARPALRRALASTDAPNKSDVDRIASVWLTSGAFEHVFCGEANDNGTIGGIHLWSRYYLEEQAHRATYTCSIEGLDDPDIATVRYRWKPEKLAAEVVKPVGSFQLGMSPSCLLAVGVMAHEHRCAPSQRLRSAFRAKLYGSTVDWVFWTTNEGTLTTLFPLADDAKGARTPRAKK